MGTLTIRVPDATHERLKQLAKAKSVSVNKLIEELSAAALAEFDAETRFRIRAARGKPAVGLKLLDKLDRSAAGREARGESRGLTRAARMGLFVRLPREYDFDPGDGHPMALRLLCLNSVDGSSPLRMLLGWYRFVCANGLAVGTTQSELRLVHREGSMCGDVAELLREGIALAEREKAGLRLWGTLRVPLARFVSFADDELAAAWGVRAAARFLHIATTGFDADLAYPFEPGPPHAKTMTVTRRVAGSPEQASSAYDACQILAWIAKDRREPQARVDWMMQIPGLMQGMLGRG